MIWKEAFVVDTEKLSQHAWGGREKWQEPQYSR